MGRPAQDLTGQRFGRLVVIERSKNSADGHARWKCQCDCGNITVVASNVLKKKTGGTKSCGCLVKERASEIGKNRYIDLTEQRFGKLVAKEVVGTTGDSKLWRCECECGNTNFITTANNLRQGNTQSCGCLKSSVGELNIEKLLKANNIEYEKEKNLFKKYRYDFYLPQLKRLIEFDGKQHFEDTKGWNNASHLENIQVRDKEKNEYALSHNIPLIRIPYWERDNITLEMLLGDKYLVH